MKLFSYKKPLTQLLSLTLWLVLVVSTPAKAAGEPVCAEVKIEIKQELTLERQGFDARMKINNELDTIPLEDVTIAVNFKDSEGNTVVASSDPNATDATFFIRVDSLENIQTNY